MRKVLRIIPLLSVPVVAIALMRGELTEAAWMTVVAVLKTVGWGVWTSRKGSCLRRDKLDVYQT